MESFRNRSAFDEVMYRKIDSKLRDVDFFEGNYVNQKNKSKHKWKYITLCVLLVTISITAGFCTWAGGNNWKGWSTRKRTADGTVSLVKVNGERGKDFGIELVRETNVYHPFDDVVIEESEEDEGSFSEPGNDDIISFSASPARVESIGHHKKRSKEAAKKQDKKKMAKRKPVKKAQTTKDLDSDREISRRAGVAAQCSILGETCYTASEKEGVCEKNVNTGIFFCNPSPECTKVNHIGRPCLRNEFEDHGRCGYATKGAGVEPSFSCKHAKVFDEGYPKSSYFTFYSLTRENIAKHSEKCPWLNAPCIIGSDMTSVLTLNGIRQNVKGLGFCGLTGVCVPIMDTCGTNSALTEDRPCLVNDSIEGFCHSIHMGGEEVYQCLARKNVQKDVYDYRVPGSALTKFQCKQENAKMCSYSDSEGLGVLYGICDEDYDDKCRVNKGEFKKIQDKAREVARISKTSKNSGLPDFVNIVLANSEMITGALLGGSSKSTLAKLHPGASPAELNKIEVVESLLSLKTELESDPLTANNYAYDLDCQDLDEKAKSSKVVFCGCLLNVHSWGKCSADGECVSDFIDYKEKLNTCANVRGLVLGGEDFNCQPQISGEEVDDWSLPSNSIEHNDGQVTKTISTALERAEWICASGEQRRRRNDEPDDIESGTENESGSESTETDEVEENEEVDKQNPSEETVDGDENGETDDQEESTEDKNESEAGQELDDTEIENGISETAESSSESSGNDTSDDEPSEGEDGAAPEEERKKDDEDNDNVGEDGSNESSHTSDDTHNSSTDDLENDDEENKSPASAINPKLQMVENINRKSTKENTLPDDEEKEPGSLSSKSFSLKSRLKDDEEQETLPTSLRSKSKTSSPPDDVEAEDEQKGSISDGAGSPDDRLPDDKEEEEDGTLVSKSEEQKHVLKHEPEAADDVEEDDRGPETSTSNPIALKSSHSLESHFEQDLRQVSSSSEVDSSEAIPSHKSSEEGESRFVSEETIAEEEEEEGQEDNQLIAEMVEAAEKEKVDAETNNVLDDKLLREGSSISRLNSAFNVGKEDNVKSLVRKLENPREVDFSKLRSSPRKRTSFTCQKVILGKVSNKWRNEPHSNLKIKFSYIANGFKQMLEEEGNSDLVHLKLKVGCAGEKATEEDIQVLTESQSKSKASDHHPGQSLVVKDGKSDNEDKKSTTQNAFEEQDTSSEKESGVGSSESLSSKSTSIDDVNLENKKEAASDSHIGKGLDKKSNVDPDQEAIDVEKKEPQKQTNEELSKPSINSSADQTPSHKNVGEAENTAPVEIPASPGYSTPGPGKTKVIKMITGTPDKSKGIDVFLADYEDGDEFSFARKTRPCAALTLALSTLASFVAICSLRHL